MKLRVLLPQEWAKFSEAAHLVVFDERRPTAMERISFALVVETEEGKPAGYATIKELDSETAYFQYGGAFPGTKGTTAALRAYRMIMRFIRDGYRRAGTLIENTNTPMLKFAMNEGWVISGLRVYDGKILLEHKIDF
ncbi:MAG: hypothetical protein KF767_08810 [Bdellovibrionaceae bacterium]|nr:hypothetical protein [Pseudobdellovibrionaceae bacterium]